jgi:hypothetical protein
MAGATVSFTAMKAIPAGSYVTFVNGLTVTSVKGTVSGMLPLSSLRERTAANMSLTGKTISAKIPSGLGGQTYVFATKSDVEKTFDDSQVIAGPAIIEVKPAAPAIDNSVL